MLTVEQEKELQKENHVKYTLYIASENYRFLEDNKNLFTNVAITDLLLFVAKEVLSRPESETLTIYEVLEKTLKELKDNTKRLSNLEEKELFKKDPFVATNYLYSSIASFIIQKNITNCQIVEQLFKKAAEFAANASDEDFGSISTYEALEKIYSSMYN